MTEKERQTMREKKCKDENKIRDRGRKGNIEASRKKRKCLKKVVV